jgi:uncharacterized membrane protein
MRMRRRPGRPQIRMSETGPSGLAFYPQAGASFERIPFALFQEFLVPPFNHLHPAIVHFPIALLATAPLLFLLGALWPAQRRGIHAAALLLLLLGLLGGLAALATGDAAEKLAHRTPELRAALNHHEFLAQWTVSIFGVLAASWLLYLGVRRFSHRDLPQGWGRLLFLLWLLISASGVVTLALTGHEGARMVHELHTHGGDTPNGW